MGMVAADQGPACACITFRRLPIRCRVRAGVVFLATLRIQSPWIAGDKTIF